MRKVSPQIISNEGLDPLYLKVLEEEGFDMERWTTGNGEFCLFSDKPDSDGCHTSIATVYPPHENISWRVFITKEDKWKDADSPHRLKELIIQEKLWKTK